MRIRRRLAAAAVLSLAVTATATASTADKKLTAKGVGKVKLGAVATDLRADGLIGRIKPGCELEAPGTKFARLRAPLKGTVDVAPGGTVKGVNIRGGAAARGVAVGDTLADITAAFPKRKIIRATEPIFGFTRIKIPKGGGGRMDFAVRVSTGKITSINVPRIRICD
jgi:hypothetical protein